MSSLTSAAHKRRRSGELRLGFTTGSAATAAAKAALLAILGEPPPGKVSIPLPDGGSLEVAVKEVQRLSEREARATVIKDAGDDPDVTHRAAITARVSLGEGASPGEPIAILGGPGVGRVTRPGLPVAVGEPAINPVPRRMIRQALRDTWRRAGRRGGLAARVEISVAEGERLARKTLNPRLGIVEGISIIGTSGLVKPFSHEAYTATIKSALSVARAAGNREVVLATGGKSEKRAMALRPDLPDTAFVQIADFFAYALRQAAASGMERVGLVSFFGKAVKQAMGLEYTHAHQAPLDLERLAGWFSAAGADEDLVRAVREANTARQVVELLRERGRLELVEPVGRRLLAQAAGFAGPGREVWAAVLDMQGGVLFQGTWKGGRS